MCYTIYMLKEDVTAMGGGWSWWAPTCLGLNVEGMFVEMLPGLMQYKQVPRLIAAGCLYLGVGMLIDVVNSWQPTKHNSRRFHTRKNATFISMYSSRDSRISHFSRILKRQICGSVQKNQPGALQAEWAMYADITRPACFCWPDPDRSIPYFACCAF